MIAPVRDGVAGKEAEWIAVTDGQYDDDKPQFSPDGNTVYFLSSAAMVTLHLGPEIGSCDQAAGGRPHRL